MTYEADVKSHIKRKARLIENILKRGKGFPKYEPWELKNLGIYQLEIIYYNLPKKEPTP